ncbi:MAG: peptide/nickel transport system ATP-binding protein [Thermotogaceae bacterium]|nr:peptide/nickel transport system ATP-binding protein [Thermotogaceae bacterium]MDN5338177.1 peptide/nickel transport system ATP-binding protein [Thermotogaceae bacterium]
MPDRKEPILIVENLKTYFEQAEGTVKAVDGVSFDLKPDEVIGIVGETGSGKSVTVKSIMRLIYPPGRIADGKILFKTDEFSPGNPQYVDITKLSEEQMTRIRGKHISMVFQDPMTSLNPMFTIEDQMIETIMFHRKVDENQAREIALEMLHKVKIPDPERRLKDYPFQLSGGQRQRVVIAIALSCNPEVLIADEPTTALDVTVQAQILELMESLQKEFHTSIIFITHDLAVIAEVANKVMVMYGGKTVEYADVFTIFENPIHPYTNSLLNCIPRVDVKQDSLSPIPGQPPVILNAPPVCPFLPRCNFRTKRCEEELPGLVEVSPGHYVRCFEEIIEKLFVSTRGGQK